MPKRDITQVTQRPGFTAPRQHATPMQGQGQPRPRILVVDDDEGLREANAMILQAQGFDVELAETGLKALEKVQQGRFDAIVSDVSMPQMDGLTLLRTLRSAKEDVPVILMTGGPSLETAIKAVEFGALRYFTKPVEPAEMTRAVKQAVVLHRMSTVKKEMTAALGTAASSVVTGEPLLDALRTVLLPIYHLRSKTLFGYTAQWLLVPKLRAQALDKIADYPKADRSHYLGTTVRRRLAEHLTLLQPRVPILVPIGVRDLFNEALYEFEAPLAQHASVVHYMLNANAELCAAEGRGARFKRLRALGYRFALADFGNETAGLQECVKLKPEIVVLDAPKFVNIETNPAVREFLGDTVTLCRDMQATLIAEGAFGRAFQQALVAAGVEVFENPT